VLAEDVEDVHLLILYVPGVRVLALALTLLLPKRGVLIPWQSLGSVSLGMTHAQVQQRWGTDYGRCRNCKQETWYFNYKRFEPRGAAVRFRAGRVVAVWTLWQPKGWRVDQVRLGAPAAALTARFGASVTVPCSSYQARIVTKDGVTTVFYVFGDRLWGFGLIEPGASPCR
jgi:hypothetical protein